MFDTIDADVYLMVDGDNTYLPEKIDQYIDPILCGDADMVVGDRLSATYFKENKRHFHGIGNIMVQRFVNMLFGVKLKDIMSGYRVFNRKFVEKITVLSSGFEVETELTVFAIENNFIIKEIPVNYKDRIAGSMSKLNTYSDGIRVLRTLFMLVRDYKPFAFFSTLSLLFTLVGIIFLVPVFIDYFRTGLVARFPTLIFGCFILIVALLMFCVGLILDVINRQIQRISISRYRA